MAGFCKQCSEHTFGEDLGDFRGIGGEDTPPDACYRVLCDGCGHTLVDNAGACISRHCLVNHKTGRERRRRAARAQ